MKLSRRVSWFLLAFGVWSWIVWTTFVKNLWKDTSGLAFHHHSHSHPTAYFWIHLTLAIVSFLLGTVIGALGIRGLLALRRGGNAGVHKGRGELRDQPSPSASGLGGTPTVARVATDPEGQLLPSPDLPQSLRPGRRPQP